MSQIKQLDFSGHTLFCDIDVHKKNWRVNIRSKEFELEDFSQDANVDIFYRHITRKYPNASFKVCYEAGFSGFSAQRWLAEKGVNCCKVNAADVITTHKDQRRKTDKSDARKLCEHLQSNRSVGVYIPEVAGEHGRSLTRAREKIVRNQTRCKNRIWQLLYFSGLSVPKQYETQQYWSKQFVDSLRSISCGSEALQTALLLYIKDYEQTRSLLLEATRAIGNLCKQQEYKSEITLLRSIPGIGLINAAVILFELQDINRFKNFDQLSSYVGFVPDTNQSGESNYDRGITVRHNSYLRSALVESSWQVIRKDTALLLKFKQYCKRMNRNRAIVRIAKHLLSRIKYVLKNKVEYEIGIVGG